MVAVGVEAVLLDVDETLVDTRHSFRAAMTAVAGHYLPHLGEEGPDLALAHWTADPDGHYDAYVGGSLGFREQRLLRAAALHRDLGGAEVDAADFRAWEDVYERAFRSTWQALPGARELIDRLVVAALPLGAVTNHQVAYQRDKLEQCGLGDVEVLVGLDTLGIGKPDARVFAEACRRLGSDPARTAYVGNDLVVDALGARDAGLQAVWLDLDGPASPAGEVPAGVARVRSLAEAAAWLDLGAAARAR